jgi:hypothetical protein
VVVTKIKPIQNHMNKVLDRPGDDVPKQAKFLTNAAVTLNCPNSERVELFNRVEA